MVQGMGKQGEGTGRLSGSPGVQGSGRRGAGRPETTAACGGGWRPERKGTTKSERSRASRLAWLSEEEEGSTADAAACSSGPAVA